MSPSQTCPSCAVGRAYPTCRGYNRRRSSASGSGGSVGLFRRSTAICVDPLGLSGPNLLKCCPEPDRSRRAPVAQRIEHLTSDQVVGGSNPSGRATFPRVARPWNSVTLQPPPELWAPQRLHQAVVRRAFLSAVLVVVLALSTAERDPAEQQHPGHIWATADVDRHPGGLDHLVGGRAGRGCLAVVVPGQDLRSCPNAHFVDESRQVLITGTDPMAARRGLPLKVIKVERLADLDRGELGQLSASSA